jgi:hypothetical protein
MLFNFKKKKLVLDCFTSESHVFNLQPIQKASNFIPQWWSNLPTYKELNMPFGGYENMRGCRGFTNLYSKGFILPLWSDAAFEIAPKGELGFNSFFADENTQVDLHHDEQRGSYLSSLDYQHLKIISPWLFRCNKDISWMFQQPTWNYEKPEDIIIPPAIVDFSGNSSTNINIALPRDDNSKQILIKFGTPMAHIIPLTDSKVELKNHLISASEYMKIGKAERRVAFGNSYIKRKQAKSKCPMGH